MTGKAEHEHVGITDGKELSYVKLGDEKILLGRVEGYNTDNPTSESDLEARTHSARAPVVWDQIVLRTQADQI